MKHKLLIIIAAAIFILGIGGSLLVLLLPKKQAVQIKHGAEVLYTFDLTQEPDRTFEIKTDDGTNTIEIKDGKIRVSEADCPDKTCVRMGWLNSAAMPVVCLPHHLVIGFADGGEGGVDAVAE